MPFASGIGREFPIPARFGKRNQPTPLGLEILFIFLIYLLVHAQAQPFEVLLSRTKYL